MEKQLIEVFKRMKNDQLIDKHVFERIKSTASIIPRLYGMPKIHKTGLPLRRILDMSGSPYHCIAKWLASLLEPVGKHICKHSVRDTFEFIEHIKVNVSDKIMLPLDVESLFINVPLTETISLICKYINNNEISIGIPDVYLKELLLRCTCNVQFTFNDVIYRQKDAVAMGSPLGPLLALDLIPGLIIFAYCCKVQKYNQKAIDGPLIHV
ncbi:unnamed protein product [Schistosoma bovis]|nr:unnamed protein product [Schistosoma bovis]